MTPKSRKRLLRFILIPILLLIVLAVTAIAILYTQRERLVGLGVNELNKQLPGRLTVEGSNISLFENYPYISIGLKNVRLYPSKQGNVKPIYEAERVLVGFSLDDILRQKYRVKIVVLKNGHLDLVEENNGALNIVEASRIKTDTTATKDTSSSAPLKLSVKKIVLKNMDISFLNMSSGQKIAFHIDRIQASFRVNGPKMLADLDGSRLNLFFRDPASGQQVVSHIDQIKSALRIDSLTVMGDLKMSAIMDYTRPGDTTLFRNKHLVTELQLSYDRPARLLKVPVGKIRLEDAVFNITGTADLLHDNTVDLKISGDKPDFRQLFAFAPASVAKELKHFKYDGILNFDATLKGKLKDGEMPGIELSFSCSNAWLHNTEANKKLDSLSFKGYYTNGAAHSLKTSELRLTDMHARPDKGIFSGNFIMRDFTDPKILMQINSELELGFVGAFLGIKDLQRITGYINLKMDFKELVDLSLPEKSMAKLTQGIQSELIVKNLTFRVPNYPYIIENLDLHAAMKNGLVKLDSMAFKVGNSDLRLDGSISDLPALFHQQDKPVQLTLNAHSNKLIFKELLAFDTARSRKAKEEIYGFNIGLSLETSVNQLQHPSPLPKGKFKLQNLFATFKQYPHGFHNFGADLTINDTALMLRNLAGNIDSSDVRFSGRVNNYQLWFEKVKKGKTLIAFDLKSKHLAMKDLLGRRSRDYVPKDYHEEVGANIWLRSKWELRYDSVFKFANVKIANISGELKKHAFRLDSVSGNVKFGTDNFVRVDTLKGKIGNSDFNLSMRLYTGKDTARRKKENYLQFASRFLDVDQLTNYRLTAAEDETPALSSAPAPASMPAAATSPNPSAQVAATNPSAQAAVTNPSPSVQTVAKTNNPSAHANAFNIFQIPFIDFKATVNVGKIKYHRLWMKNFYTNVRMQSNQQLYLDTLTIGIAEGRIGARAHFNGSDPNKIYLRSRIRVDDVNIEKMMLKLDYFGQDYVINKNIKGRLNGQIKSYVRIHPDLTPLINESEAQLDIDIRNGELVNFAPIRAMSSYFKDKNLNIVRFDTLRNTLSFKNGALSIPSMNINTSLGFMEISGTQSLDTHMEYYVRIPLKMVTQVGFRMLFGKKQEEVDPDQVDAIEYRDKDKRVRFMNLKISGTPDDYKVGLGKAKKS
ncbi:MAG TPA: AsmA-like C-terminal region-containing protein [Puia sp.]|nr:AsmA-like C-terminal region-containing protein [Puia sp.]